MASIFDQFFNQTQQAPTTTSTTPKTYLKKGYTGTMDERYNQFQDAGYKSPVSWYNSEADSMLNMGEGEAIRLRDQEESRGQRAEDLIGAAKDKANVPSMSEQDIRRGFSQSADAASGDLLGRMNSLRSYLGGAGITGGGLASGLATQYALAARGQMTDARRSLFLEKSKSDALDRARNFQNELTYASAVNRPVSMLYSDYLGQAAGIRLGQGGVERQYMAAEKAARASEKGGVMGAIGGIAGGVLGAVL